MSGDVPEEIVSEEGMLRAMLDRVLDGWILTVGRSLLVREDDPLFAPVAELLAASCTLLVEASSLVSEGIAFGRGYLSIHKGYPECPGPSVPHRCRTAEGIDDEVRRCASSRDAAAA